MNKVSIEISVLGLAELLDYAKTGMQELGEVTPAVIETFKELVNKLPKTAWNYETLHEFAASLDTIDGPDEDYSFILDDTNDYDDY